MKHNIFVEFQNRINKISDEAIIYFVAPKSLGQHDQQKILRDLLESVFKLDELKVDVMQQVMDVFILNGSNECNRLKKLYSNELYKLRDWIYASLKEKNLSSEETGFEANSTDTTTVQILDLSKEGKVILTFNDVCIKFQFVVFNLLTSFNKIQSEYTNPFDVRMTSIKETSLAIEVVPPKILFIDLFRNVSDYNEIIELLARRELIDPVTKIWIDTKKGKATYLIAILKDLKGKGYYKTPASVENKTYRSIAINTFGMSLKIDTVKRANPLNFHLNFIPPCSSIS